MEALLGMFCTAMIAMFVLMIFAMRASARNERERQAMLWKWADANGWTYALRARAPWTARLPGNNSHGLGVSLTGLLGDRWVTVADYSYETTSHTTTSDGSTRTDTTTHRYIAVVVHLDRVHPPIAVHSRGLVSQFGRALFGDKPTATGNVRFDAHFRIAAADPVHSKALVGPALIDAHINRAVPLWNIVGTDLLAQHPISGTLRDPNQIAAHAAPLLRVADLLGR